MRDFPFHETRYGFAYGPLKVERIFSDPGFGVVIHVGSDHVQYQVRVSPHGRKVQITEEEHVYWHKESE